MNQYQLIDGTKSIPINQLPESAWTVFGGNEDKADLRTLCASVAFLYRCVEIRANAISVMPWYIGRGDTDIWSNGGDQLPSDLSYLEDFPDLLWQIEASLSMSSQAFMHKERNRVRLLGLRWLAPWSVTPKWNENSGLESFERQLRNRKIVFQPDEIVYLRLPGQHETEPRKSPANAAMSSAGILYSKDVFAKTFFERGAIKATLLTVAGNPLPEERQRLKNWWKRAFESVGNAFSTEVISADSVVPVVVGEGLESLESNGLSTEMREDIATAMGVPHSMVVSNASNFATAMSDRRNYHEMTIVPESIIIQRQLNKQLFGPLGLRFEFRPQELDIFQQDENERADALTKYVSAGVPLDIAIKILGIDLPDGVSPESLLPEPQPIVVQPDPEQEPDDATDDMGMNAEKAVEIQVFRRWLKKRKNPDLSQFSSEILTHAEKMAIMEDVAGEDAPFPGWESYP